MLFAVVIVVIDIDVAKTERAVVRYPFWGVLVLAPTNGAKCDTVLHNSICVIPLLLYYATPG